MDTLHKGDNDDNDDNNNIINNITYNRNTAHMECKSKGDTPNKWSDWDQFKIIQKTREQHTRKP
jgi:hypothetical protein